MYDGTNTVKPSLEEGCCSALLNYGNEESDGGGHWDDGDRTEESYDVSEPNNDPEESVTSEEESDDTDEESSPPHYFLPEQVEKQLRLLDIDPSRTEPFLCSQCRATDLLAALDHTSRAAQGAANPLVVAERAGIHPECVLCSLFARTFLSEAPLAKDESMATETAPSSVLSPWKLSAFNKRCMLMDIRISWMFQPVEVAILYAGEDAHVQHINEERVEREGFLACARTRDLRALLEKSQSTVAEPLSRFVLPQYDPGLVREWLGLCDFDLDDHRFSIPGMRVIDCHTRTIVDHTPGTAYFALSYVWGLANADMIEVDACLLNEANALPLPQMIPRVVANAIQVVQEAGYRYLWVDQFCIDQSAAKEHIAEQISKMDLLYSKAALTIIAASTGERCQGWAVPQEQKE
ncbi:HET-domain-containing protein [Apiospora arundinis]